MKTNIDFFKQLFSESFISEYDHSNYIDNVGGQKFFHMDCSGFVYWCLGQMGYRRALVELRQFLRQNDFIKINRFFCKDFKFIYEHKSEFKYWNFINKPIHGCVMFVVFQDSNGHCMFIDDIIENTGNSFILRVIDSTHYSHKNDTRTDTGIGMGDVEISYKDGIWFYNANNKSLPTRQAEIYFVIPKNNIKGK